MFALLMVVGGGLLRLVPHLPNFTPLAATAIFGGAKLGKKFAIFVPLISLALSDYLLLYINPFGNPKVDFTSIKSIAAMFHTTTLYVWGSFIISGLIGMWLRKHQKLVYIVSASLLASIQFFLITNFGVWAAGYYGPGVGGLLKSYLEGLPFFKWTLLGDLFYTGVFFGTYELAKHPARFFQSVSNRFESLH